MARRYRRRELRAIAVLAGFCYGAGGVGIYFGVLNAAAYLERYAEVEGGVRFAHVWYAESGFWTVFWFLGATLCIVASPDPSWDFVAKGRSVMAARYFATEGDRSIAALCEDRPTERSAVVAVRCVLAAEIP